MLEFWNNSFPSGTIGPAVEWSAEYLYDFIELTGGTGISGGSADGLKGVDAKRAISVKLCVELKFGANVSSLGMGSTQSITSSCWNEITNVSEK